MQSQVLKSIQEDLKTLDPQIEEAEELIAALKSVGEDVRDMESQLRTLKIRRDKWQAMLKARGYVG